MIEKQCKNTKSALPEWLVKKRANRPVLAMWIDFYLEAFWNLCTERVFSEVVLNISWSSIQRYADYYEMDFEESESFHYIIKKVDTAYVNKMREKNGKTSSSNEQQKQPSEPRKTTPKRNPSHKK